MKYSLRTQKAAVDAVIHMLRRGVLGPKSELAHHADVLASVRDWIASVERREADKGRETARDLREVMTEEINRIR